MLTIMAHCELDLDQGSHGCKPSAFTPVLPIDSNANPSFQQGSSSFCMHKIRESCVTCMAFGPSFPPIELVLFE